MAHRKVTLVNKTATTTETHADRLRRGGFNQIRVEIRVIAPPHAKMWEVVPLLDDAHDEMRKQLFREQDGGTGSS